MNDIAFQVLKVVLTVCAFVVTVYAVPYLDALAKNEKYAGLSNAVGVFVRAAEQTIKGKGAGAEKKEYVMAAVTAWLSQRGISMTADKISDLIEAAVYGMNMAKGE